MKDRFLSVLRHVTAKRHRPAPVTVLVEPVRIGLALGGGFARGIAHAGVLTVFENHRIPIHCITGVSAGAIVAAAYASGATPAEIAHAGCSMRFGDVARWSLSRMGFVVNERMQRFLQKLLKRYRFEDMRIPLGVTATDLCSGEEVDFRGSGDVFLPIRASCSYPGLFQPVHYQERLLVDGSMSVEAPAELARQLGANRVITVYLPGQGPDVVPTNMFQVVNRCFQILQTRAEDSWRKHSDLVIAPAVRSVQWDGFGSGPDLIEAGATAALNALPKIQAWLDAQPRGQAPAAPVMPSSKPA
jgi:NTE family protein